MNNIQFIYLFMILKYFLLLKYNIIIIIIFSGT